MTTYARVNRHAVISVVEVLSELKGIDAGPDVYDVWSVPVRYLHDGTPVFVSVDEIEAQWEIDETRWQPWEINLINAGWCAHQTGHGLPGMTYCESRTTVQGKPFCAAHEQETEA